MTPFLLHLLLGCSPQSSAPELHSQIFSRVEVVGVRGTGLGQFTKPRSLALDRDDNLYVVDMTGRVQKFSPSGEVLSSWRMPETELGKPKGMCRDTNGNIVVLEPHYQRVNHFAPDGSLVSQWGEHGTNIGQLTLPRSVAVNSSGDVFLSEYTTVDRVQGFSGAKHQPLVCFGRPGTGDGEFNRAEGLDIDAQDRIYVADSCNHRIQIFSREGKWLKTYGRAGRGLGELSYPYDVRLDRQGRQYVCEFGNSRIQVFDPNNQPIEIVGGVGRAPGQFNNPWAIALDSRGNLYVADAGNHRVQKLVVGPKSKVQGLTLITDENDFEIIGPPSPQPSPPGEGARRSIQEFRTVPTTILTRSDAARDSRVFQIPIALPLLGERAGVRADQILVTHQASRMTESLFIVEGPRTSDFRLWRSQP